MEAEAFHIYALRLWNQLLIHIWKSESDLFFESKLKRNVFDVGFNLVRYVKLTFLIDAVEKNAMKGHYLLLMISSLSDPWKYREIQKSQMFTSIKLMQEEVVKWDTRTVKHKNCMKYSPLVHRWKSLCNSGSFWHKIILPLQIKPIYQTLAKPCPRFLSSCFLPPPLLTSILRRFLGLLFFSSTFLFFCWYRTEYYWLARKPCI